MVIAAVASSWGFTEPDLVPLPREAQVDRFGFWNGKPPTPRDVEKLVEVIASELTSEQFDLEHEMSDLGRDDEGGIA